MTTLKRTLYTQFERLSLSQLIHVFNSPRDSQNKRILLWTILPLSLLGLGGLFAGLYTYWSTIATWSVFGFSYVPFGETLLFTTWNLPTIATMQLTISSWYLWALGGCLASIRIAWTTVTKFVNKQRYNLMVGVATIVGLLALYHAYRSHMTSSERRKFKREFQFMEKLNNETGIIPSIINVVNGLVAIYAGFLAVGGDEFSATIKNHVLSSNFITNMYKALYPSARVSRRDQFLTDFLEKWHLDHGVVYKLMFAPTVTEYDDYVKNKLVELEKDDKIRQLTIRAGGVDENPRLNDWMNDLKDYQSKSLADRRTVLKEYIAFRKGNTIPGNADEVINDERRYQERFGLVDTIMTASGVSFESPMFERIRRYVAKSTSLSPIYSLALSTILSLVVNYVQAHKLYRIKAWKAIYNEDGDKYPDTDSILVSSTNNAERLAEEAHGRKINRGPRPVWVHNPFTCSKCKEQSSPCAESMGMTYAIDDKDIHADDRKRKYFDDTDLTIHQPDYKPQDTPWWDDMYQDDDAWDDAGEKSNGREKPVTTKANHTVANKIIDRLNALTKKMEKIEATLTKAPTPQVNKPKVTSQSRPAHLTDMDAEDYNNWTKQPVLHKCSDVAVSLKGKDKVDKFVNAISSLRADESAESSTVDPVFDTEDPRSRLRIHICQSSKAIGCGFFASIEGKNFVVTARHCLPATCSPGPIPDYEGHVINGKDPNPYKFPLVLVGCYKDIAICSGDNVAGTLGKLGKGYAPWTVAAHLPKVGDYATVYRSAEPEGANNRKLSVSFGRVGPTMPHRITYSASTTNGTSGAPVFTWDGNKWQLVAVHTNGFPGRTGLNSGHTLVGLKLSDFKGSTAQLSESNSVTSKST